MKFKYTSKYILKSGDMLPGIEYRPADTLIFYNKYLLHSIILRRVNRIECHISYSILDRDSSRYSTSIHLDSILRDLVDKVGLVVI